jgi:hypothetical protein
MRKPAALAVVSALPVIVACALLGVTDAKAVTCRADAAGCAPFVVTIEQAGANVVATGSGEFDLTVLSGVAVAPINSAIGRNIGEMNLSFFVTTLQNHDVMDRYFVPASGPANFGPGPVTSTNITSGPEVDFEVKAPPGSDELFVPKGYSSGDLVTAAQDIFANTTLALLGVTPGVYRWTWGPAADQSFTIDAVASTTTPIPAAFPLFVTGLGALGVLGRRSNRRRAQA